MPEFRTAPALCARALDRTLAPGIVPLPTDRAVTDLEVNALASLMAAVPTAAPGVLNSCPAQPRNGNPSSDEPDIAYRQTVRQTPSGIGVIDPMTAHMARVVDRAVEEAIRGTIDAWLAERGLEMDYRNHPWITNSPLALGRDRRELRAIVSTSYGESALYFVLTFGLTTGGTRDMTLLDMPASEGAGLEWADPSLRPAHDLPQRRMSRDPRAGGAGRQQVGAPSRTSKRTGPSGSSRRAVDSIAASSVHDPARMR